jgi:hypothetical protein
MKQRCCNPAIEGLSQLVQYSSPGSWSSGGPSMARSETGSTNRHSVQTVGCFPRGARTVLRVQAPLVMGPHRIVFERRQPVRSRDDEAASAGSLDDEAPASFDTDDCLSAKGQGWALLIEVRPRGGP